MKPHRLLLSIVLVPLACFALSASLAHAELASRELEIELDYEAPGECPEAERVEREISRLLAGSQLKTKIKTDLLVERVGSGYEARLILREPVTGERTLADSNCGNALRAAALIVAMAVDPDAVTREQAETEPSALSDAPESEADEAEADEAEADEADEAEATPAVERVNPTPTPADPVDVVEFPEPEGTGPIWISLAAVAERGLAPEVAVGPFVGLGLQGEHWRVALHGAYLPSADTTAPSSEAGARFRFAWADLAACARRSEHVDRRVGLGLCGLLRQTWVFARGMGVDDSFDAQSQLQSLVLAPHLTLRVYGGFGLEAAFDVEWQLQRPRYVVENLEPSVYPTPAVGGAARLGATLRF